MYLLESKNYVLFGILFALSGITQAQSTGVDQRNSPICEISDTNGTLNGEVVPTKSIIKIKGNNAVILEKELPLKKTFYQSQTSACLINTKFAYMLQTINTNRSSSLNQNIIYLHQIDFKGRIVNSISPFSDSKSCRNGHLTLKNHSSLQVSALCIGTTNNSKEITVDQNLTLNLKQILEATKAVDSSDLKLNQPLALIGTVTGPITVGNKSEGNDFTAFYLNLNKDYSMDDKDSCGPQTFNKLAMDKFGLNKFKGKKVRVEGNIYCQPERTGTYHLNEITNISLLD